MGPIVDSHIREDIAEVVTFKLKHKFQVSHWRGEEGLENSRPKLTSAKGLRQKRT